MGIGSRNYRLYIVDFGLAKRYLTKEGHIPYKENKSLTGTVRYASINTHLGIEQSRRDDLEGLGYVLVYLAKGVLPWMNLRITNQNDKYRQIMEKKMSTTSDVLCKGLPAEFTAYMNYVKALKFEEKPDYVFLRGLFQDVFKKNQLVLDYRYDWTKAGEKVVF
jgi:serine/threonine protein kinase